MGGKYWNEWVEELGLESQNKFIVESPVYITSLINLMNEIPIDKWKDYLIVRLVKGSAGSLSDDFILESFECQLDQHDFFIELLREYTPDKQTLNELLGFKFKFYMTEVTF